jgi:hypothetical protein
MAKQKRAGRVPDHLRGKISLAVKPWNWLTKAQRLRKAANLLFISFEAEHEAYDKDHSYKTAIPDGSTIEMLIGFAVENLLKGLHATTRSNIENVKDLKELIIPGSRHELTPIAEALKEPPLSLKFSKEEYDILSVLEHVILWFGRYPSATSIDDLIPRDDNGFKKFYFTYPDDHFAALRLYDRLESALAERATKPPRGSN